MNKARVAEAARGIIQVNIASQRKLFCEEVDHPDLFQNGVMVL